VLSRRVVEQMNQMMHQVVMEGTGRRAQLDFTYTAGKTGTSSSYRDAWFVGFTGQYVTGVWIGNDDYRPMNNVTGGTIPTLAWHSYMSVAHTNMDIPPIPGLAVHPAQIAERQRLEEQKRLQVIAQRDNPIYTSPAAGTQQRRSNSLMSDQTREALKRVAQAMRTAAGLPGETAPAAPQQGSPPGQGGPPAAGRRADGTSGGAGTLSSATVTSGATAGTSPIGDRR